MPKFGSTRLWNGLFLACSTLFVGVIGIQEIALNNSAAINNFLHIETTLKNGDSTYFKSSYSDKTALKNHLQSVAQSAEGEGLVLLKNANGALPLSSGARVSLFGSASVKFNYNTSGSSSTSSAGYPSLKETLEGEGLSVNPTLDAFYRSGAGASYGRNTSGSVYLIHEAPYSLFDSTAVSSFSSYGDAAILTLARDSGEGKDLSTTSSDGEDGSYLSLAAEERDLLEQLTTLKKQGTLKKIIVLLNSSNPLELDFLKNSKIDVDALMWVGNVGSYGLSAVGDALLGKINPSGRLSDTYCYDDFSSPSMASWGLNRRKLFSSGYSNYSTVGLDATNRNYGVYVEGIYVGYRYYETRYFDAVMGRTNVGDFDYKSQVAYPFGYGLSYTDFTVANFSGSEKGDEFDFSVDVSNSGKVAGKHAVQLYLQKPYTSYDVSHGLEKSAVELAAFAKSDLLAPGAKQTLTFSVKKSQLKNYDNDGYKTYILEEGTYHFALAENAHDAANVFLAGEGKNSANPSYVGANGDSSFLYSWTNAALDSTSYSLSAETGVKITNQFDHADMKRYAGKGNNTLNYVSRNDWAGSFPQKEIVWSVDSETMKQDLSSNKTLPNEGTMPTYSNGKKMNVASLRSSAEAPIAFDDSRWNDLLDTLSFAEQAKLVSSGQYATITLASVGLPEAKAADGPTAVTQTVTETAFPSEGIWASTMNLKLIEEVGDAIAEDAMACGIHGMYAPGVNLHRTPFIGRSNEYFSEDPLQTALSAVAEIKGLQGKGVIAHVKHFAFNDEETNRNGIGIWLNEQSARELYLLPFEYALTPSKGNAAALMSSFNRAGCLWLGADGNAQKNVAQKEWGFTGYIVTDMAISNGSSYMLYNDGFANGTSLFMKSGSESALDEWKANAYFANAVRDATHRILYSITNYSYAMNGIDSSSGVVYVTPWWQSLLLGLKIGFGVLAGVSLAFNVVTICLRKKSA